MGGAPAGAGSVGAPPGGGDNPSGSFNCKKGSSRKKDKKYIFNVGGIRHETYRATLYSVPNTRLYSIATKNPRDAEEFDSESREFFFDRHPGAFEQIINFYRTGQSSTHPLYHKNVKNTSINTNQVRLMQFSSTVFRVLKVRFWTSHVK